MAEGAPHQDRESYGGSRFGSRDKEFSLNMLRLRYLWDSRAKTIKKLLDPEVWILEETSELEMLTLGLVRNDLSNGPGVAMRRYLAGI